jgi:hypothetical protein
MIKNKSPLTDDIIYNIKKIINISDISIVSVNSDESYSRFIILTNNDNYNPLLTQIDINKMKFMKPLKIHNMIYNIYMINNNTIMMYLDKIIDIADDEVYNIISIKNNKLHHNKEYCSNNIYFEFTENGIMDNELFNKYKIRWHFVSLYGQI